MSEQSLIDIMNAGGTKNWIKVGLAFYELKDVLWPIVNEDYKQNYPDRKPASETDIYHILKFIYDKKQIYPDTNVQKAAEQLLLDRNQYVHDLTKAEISNNLQSKWKDDILNLLQILENQGLTNETATARERIEQIFDQDYQIVSEDQYKLRMSNFEGRLFMLETQIEEERMLTEKKLQSYDKEIQSIKQFRESSGDDSRVGQQIQAMFDEAERDLMKLINNHEKRITMLESHAYEITNQQGEIREAVGYLLMKDPEIQKREKAQQYVGLLQAAVDWDPTSATATSQLVAAANEDNLIMFDMLVGIGVSLGMKDISIIKSAKGLEHAIAHLDRMGLWDPQSSSANDALDAALLDDDRNILYILTLNGVYITAGGGCD